MFRTRSLMQLVLCVAVLCGTAVADLPRPKSMSGKGVNSPVVEDTRVEGVWAVLSAEKGGDKLPEEITKETTVTFRDGKVMLEMLGEAMEATYTLDVSKRPGRIDMTRDGKTEKGIFILRADTLTIYTAEPGNPRPTAFATAGSDHTVVVLKRKR